MVHLVLNLAQMVIIITKLAAHLAILEIIALIKKRLFALKAITNLFGKKIAA